MISWNSPACARFERALQARLRSLQSYEIWLKDIGRVLPP
jgi:hypothetical protein